VIGAFALSEAGSGSDALSAQARAVRSADGSFILNGTKMWITNGGFADLFILFVRLEGEGFSAFLVERTFQGVTASREEEKLGLRGSSTTRVVLDNVAVPAQNLLGEPGKGHRPALYSLNLGRLAIAATSVGGPADILKHEHTAMLFPPKDADALTSTLLKFVNDPVLRRRIGQQGARHVRRRWLWPNIVKKMRCVYEEIA